MKNVVSSIQQKIRTPDNLLEHFEPYYQEPSFNALLPSSQAHSQPSKLQNTQHDADTTLLDSSIPSLHKSALAHTHTHIHSTPYSYPQHTSNQSSLFPDSNLTNGTKRVQSILPDKLLTIGAEMPMNHNQDDMAMDIYKKKSHIKSISSTSAPLSNTSLSINHNNQSLVPHSLQSSSFNSELQRLHNNTHDGDLLKENMGHKNMNTDIWTMKPNNVMGVDDMIFMHRLAPSILVNTPDSLNLVERIVAEETTVFDL